MFLAFGSLLLGWVGFVFAVANIAMLCHDAVKRNYYLGLMPIIWSWVRMTIIAIGFSVWFYMIFIKFPMAYTPWSMGQ